MRKVSSAHTGDSTFCLDQECHAILQAEARREQSTQRQEQQERNHGGESTTREVTLDDDNRVDINQQQLQFHRDYLEIEGADFDTRVCDGCKHRHIALLGSDTDQQREVDACFLLSCYHEKDAGATRAKKLVKDHIQEAVAKRVRFDGELAARVLAWSAALTPEVSTGEDGESIAYGYSVLDETEETDEALFECGLTHVGRFLSASNDQLGELGAYVVTVMHWNDVKQLAAAMKVTIDDYLIDEHYLAEHTEDELKVMANAIKWKPVDFAELANAENSGTIDRFILQRAGVFGVPKEIRFAYEQLTREDD